MTIPAQSIIQRVVETLQDSTSIRWPVNELVRYLNDGQREIILHRPDAMRTNISHPLVPGTKQSLPPNGTKLIEVIRNSGGNKRAITQTKRDILDSSTSNGGWHNLTGTTEVLHFIYDPRDPVAFYVYPPAAVTGASVDLVYAAMPTDVAAVADGGLHDDVTGNISVPDIYGNALQDYILFRAYTKDSTYAGNGARAQAHYALFTNALGIEVKATVAVAPTTAGNPNMAAAA